MQYVPSAREQARSRRSMRFEKEYIEGEEMPTDVAEIKSDAMDGAFVDTTLSFVITMRTAS